MKTRLTNSNFISGVLSNSLNGRYTLPLYQNGLSFCENFNLGYEGGLQKRMGFKYTVTTQEAVYLDFRFNETQSYLVELATDNKIYFLTYDTNGVFGYVESTPGVKYYLTSPYTLTQAKVIAKGKHFAQKGDIMYITHKDVKPKKLTRLTATTFSIADVVFNTTSPATAPFDATTLYPNCCAFYENRLYYAGIGNEPTYIYASDVGSYDSFTVTGGSDEDLDGFKLDLAETNQRIDFLFPAENSLVAGSSDGLIPISSGSTAEATSKLNIVARKAIEDGTNGSSPIKVDNTAIYIDYTNRKTRSFSYDLLSEKFKAPNLNLANMDLTVDGLRYVVTKKDDYNYFYALIEDGTMLVADFIGDENINGWAVVRTGIGEIKEAISLPRGDGFEDLIISLYWNSGYHLCILENKVDFKSKELFFTDNENTDKLNYYRYVAEQMTYYNYLDLSQIVYNLYDYTITYDPNALTITSDTAVFSSGDVGNRIVYSTTDGEDYGIFKIISYTSNKIVGVELLSESYSSLTSSSWYLTFNTITGLSLYEGQSISVSADGGYLDDYIVSSGEITLTREVSVAYVGFKYTSIAKSLNLGFDVNGITTQTTNKNINKFIFRLNYSAGGKFGTDRYNLKDIQEFDPIGYYDRPPLLINGDVAVKNLDGWTPEKSYYIIQEDPLPLNISMITYEMESNTN